MDGRIALAPGTVLKLETATGYTRYTINREVGRGGSCIVYDASYADNLGNFKLVRIKECFPYALRLKRNEGGMLTAETRDETAFAAARERMTAAYQKNHELFSLEGLTNSVANTVDIYQANGTVYIVSVYMNGRTFSENQGASLHDCVSLMLSAAGVLKRIHDAGYLYLDLKPDNILTLEGTTDLVQLFDFDSLVSMEEITAAIRDNDVSALRTSYTRGYAPLELQTGKLKQLGKHSDLYSLGAVLFYALWHRTPTAFDCNPSAKYDYSHMTRAEKPYQDRLYQALTAFFHKTITGYTADRYRDAEEAMAQLRIILALSDETKPWIRSTPLRKMDAFYGRNEEAAALSRMLERAEGGLVSLYGVGGIGKSTLARQCLSDHASGLDAVIWLYDRGDLSESVADDTLVHVNTVRRLKEEGREDYLSRKLRALTDIAHEQRVLLVLDNFQPEHLEQLKPFLQVGWTVLLISRERLPEGMCPEMALEEMDEAALAEMFGHYSRRDLSEAADRESFRKIIGTIGHHTLLTELIARQVAKSWLDLQAAEEMITGMGLSDLPPEKIDYVKDQSVFHETLLKILDRLVEIDQFSENDRICLKLLSLFSMPGIEAELFRSLAGLENLDFVNELEASGWVKTEERQLYLHPLMQEYIRTWDWTEAMRDSADGMMRSLYEQIRPAGNRHDGSKQFPRDYGSFYRLLRIIPQMTDNIGYVSEASQRLLYRFLMDAPVDQDTPVMFRMLDLLKDPRYLDDDSILRLYEMAAYYRARLYAPDDALELLQEMRQYLRGHPSAYYLSAYHRATAIILHNANRDLKTILHHEDRAIITARLSGHPDAKKQLAASLMNKARTLMNEETDLKQARRLLREAGTLVSEHTGPLDYERYQYDCTAAMCFAMDGDLEAAQAALEEADAIVYQSPDSDLAVAEHLIEENAPIRMEMNQFEAAAEAVLQAIQLCEKHPEALRYRETIFDAWYFLGQIYAMNSEYIRAEEAFGEAEKRVHDSPYEWRLPLCPAEIREKAEEERTHRK